MECSTTLDGLAARHPVAAAVLGAATLTGLLPCALAELAAALLAPVPGQALALGFAAALIGGAAWLLR